MTPASRFYAFPETKHKEAPAAFAVAAVREQLAKGGWHQQQDESKCQNSNGMIATTWWNRGPAALVLIEQEEVAYVARLLTSARQVAGLIARKEAK